MRVKAWKNIDVDVEVDVDIDSLFAEFWERVEQTDSEYWREVAPVIDQCTKLLAQVDAKIISRLPLAAVEEVCKRLKAELDRYESAKPRAPITARG